MNRPQKISAAKPPAPAQPAVAPAETPARALWRGTVRYLADADALLGPDGLVHRRQVVRF